MCGRPRPRDLLSCHMLNGQLFVHHSSITTARSPQLDSQLPGHPHLPQSVSSCPNGAILLFNLRKPSSFQSESVALLLPFAYCIHGAAACCNASNHIHPRVRHLKAVTIQKETKGMKRAKGPLILSTTNHWVEKAHSTITGVSRGVVWNIVETEGI
jgi:hypothetical protein